MEHKSCWPPPLSSFECRVLAGAGHEGKVAGDWERRWPLPVDPKKASRPQKHPTTTIPQQIFSSLFFWKENFPQQASSHNPG